MRYAKRFYCSLIAGLIIFPQLSFSQKKDNIQKADSTKANDTTYRVEILPGTRKMEFNKINDSTSLQILAGNVKMRQGKTLFYCDSCVINNRTNVFDAYGHVHINDADTSNIYSDYLQYFMQKKVAFLKGNVRLTDGKGTLTTPDLEYDVETKLGIYKNGGVVVNKKIVLTSQEGYYYTDLRDVYFKKNVVLIDPAYHLKTDSLIYNTESQLARFIAYTFIKDSSGRTIETNDGYYDLKMGKAEFGQRPKIRDGKIFITGNHVSSDDSTGKIEIIGKAVMIDTAQNQSVSAGEIYLNKKTNSFLAIKNPLMIIKQDNDSIYIAADTLFSARLTDLYAKQDSTIKEDSIKKENASKKIDSVKMGKKPDTTNKLNSIKKEIKEDAIKGIDSIKSEKKIDTTKQINSIKRDIKKDTTKVIDSVKGVKVVSLNEKDSTNRYFHAYHHVRIFSDSMQAVCDSMFYSFQDSVFRLFTKPVVWSKQNQITGDTILLYTKNKKAERFKVFENSFMVNKIDPEVFNQVKSTRMDGYFKDGDLDSVRAKGFAECIYFIQNEDSAYTGINEAKSEILDIYFEKKELQKVVFRTDVTGTLWPIRQKGPKEMRLSNFKWLDAIRPKTKFELMQ